METTKSIEQITKILSKEKVYKEEIIKCDHSYDKIRISMAKGYNICNCGRMIEINTSI